MAGTVRSVGLFCFSATCATGGEGQRVRVRLRARTGTSVDIWIKIRAALCQILRWIVGLAPGLTAKDGEF